jgi:uncharacterized membrane protein
MKTNLKTLVAAAALIAGIGASSVVYAHEDEASSGPMMGQMSTMMEACNKMMQGMAKKHEQSPEAHPQQQK